MNEYTAKKAAFVIAEFSEKNDGINWKGRKDQWQNRGKIPAKYFKHKPQDKKGGSIMRVDHGNKVEYTLNDILYVISSQKRIDKLMPFLEAIERAKEPLTITCKIHRIDLTMMATLKRMRIVDKKGFWLFHQPARLNKKLAIDVALNHYHFERIKNANRKLKSK